ncbi:MAG TPA: DUF222 domain-containing protein [Acidimicrobiia bacterium]
MFEGQDGGVGLLPGEGPEDVAAADQLAYELTCRELADGWVDEDRHVLPDVESVPPGPFLLAILGSVDRSRLNGFDLVRLLQARELLVAHCQAGSMADTREIAYTSPGDADSAPDRLDLPFEFAADELRPALRLTRRAAENRMALAFDLIERLPGAWDLLAEGRIDLSRARVFADATAHLSDEEAQAVVARLVVQAPRMTTGQLRARIRKLCVETDPEEAVKRYERRVEERRLWVEPTADGTANLFLLDISLVDAQVIRNRIHRHLISLPKKTRQGRTVAQLQADIAVDLLQGSNPDSGTGKGFVDLRVPLSTLERRDDHAGLIDGMEPVAADIARQIVDLSHDAEWRYTVTDDNGTIVHIGTTRRRPTKPLSRLVESLQATCAGPGCRIPASQCDFDHLQPWADLGVTSDRNGGPKCRHDHTLKAYGWIHRRVGRQDIWTSRLGHTYTYPITDHPP